MANLIIDIGNTAAKATWADGMTLGKAFRYQGERVRGFILSLVEKDRPDVMVISSVYTISESDAAAYRSLCGRLMLLDGAHTDLLVKAGLPGHLTYDRAASIFAARYLFKGKGCTVVDFGTTLTIDFTSSDGSYEGGNISLGCRTRLKALNRYSRALPLLDSPSDPEPLGTSLQGSMASGTVSGMVFEIEGYIAMRPENIVVFTGGDANYFAKRMKNSIFVVCNLVLMGLALIADEYAGKEN